MSIKPKPQIQRRNKIDLSDGQQVQIWAKRLGVTYEELGRLVEKAGPSVAAVTKEMELRKIGKAPPAPATEGESSGG